MTQINYHHLSQPTVNGENMLDRTIKIPFLGECVWVNWKDPTVEGEVRIIDLHCKEDVLNNFNPLLAYNVHPYTTDTDDVIASGGSDVSCVGGVMRLAYRTDGNGAIAIIAFFVHPRLRGKGMAKHLLHAGLSIIAYYETIETIVLNPKQHPTSPISTAVIRKWYKGLGFKELGDAFEAAGLVRPSNKKMWRQFPPQWQKKVRKEGDGLLVFTMGDWDVEKANQIASFGLTNLLADWTAH